MPLNAKVAALVQDRRYGLAIANLIEQHRQKAPATAQAFSSIQNAVNDIYRSIAQPSELTEFSVTDPLTGERIAWIGGETVGNYSYSGAAFARVWIGPNADPLQAPFFSDGSNVIIGKNGQILIQDSGQNNVGWFGVEQEAPQTITAATNASPVVVTVTAHGYIDGDTIVNAGATGNTNVNGYRIVQNVTTNTFTMTDLSGAVINGNGAFAGPATATRYYAGVLSQTIAIGESFANYKLRAFADGSLKINGAEFTLTGPDGTILLDPTVPAITVSDSGGNQWAALEIIKESPIAITAATNASPSVLTVVGNTYVNGDTLIVAGALGNTAINGYRIVQNVGTAGADTFTMTDIAGTQINGNGAYTGSGTATRYYAGGLFQSLAIGPDFANYKLRAFADGSLRIQNAAITISGSPFTITMDPTTGFSVTGNGITTLVNNTTRDGFAAGLYVYTTSSNANPVIITPGRISCNYTVGSGTSRFILGSSGAGDTQLVLNSTSAGFGNLQIASITTTGGLQINGNNLANATNCTITTQGVATFAGTVDAVSGFKKNGVSGLSVSRSFGTSLTVNTVSNGVIGTPGAGQSNTTLVTGVTLNVTSNTWSGGILTT